MIKRSDKTMIKPMIKHHDKTQW